MSSPTPPQRGTSTPLSDAAEPVHLRFGHFELQLADRRLLADGQPVVLQARALDVLIALTSRAGRLVTRQQLMDQVWPGLYVEDNNLSVQINALRRALGGEHIATVPGRGYRFTADIVVSKPISTAFGGMRPDVRISHLPEVLPELIGREEALCALASEVEHHALVTVLGAGGAGKTRLAQALLHQVQSRYADGVCFVELATATQADAVPAYVAASLGLRLAANEDAASSLARALAPLQMLIALDNAEHQVAAVGALALTVLGAAPGVRLVVTSQSPLRVSQESIYRLAPLAVPAEGADASAAMHYGAVALLVARVQAVDHRFHLDRHNLDRVVELCRRLDGSALAIELAAARLPLLGLSGLIQALAERLSVLTQGQAGAPPRQRTLRAALQWSHDLLSPKERAVFRQLSVFTGSASLAMILRVIVDPAADAATLANDKWDVLDALGGLVERSLASPADEPGSDAEADPRYRLLDTPRALAAEHLTASGEDTVLRRRHAQAFSALLDSAYRDLLAGRARHDEVCAMLAPDLDNVRAALTWALVNDPGLALAIAPALSFLLGDQRQAERVALWRDIEPLLDAHPKLPVDVRARAYAQCAEVWCNTRTQHALDRAQLALALALEAGDHRQATLIAAAIGSASWRLGNSAALQHALDVVSQAEQAGWPPFVRAAGAAARAWHCMIAKDPSGARHWFGEQARCLLATGLDDSLALNNIAGLQLDAGETEAAIALTQSLVDRLAGERDRFRLAISVANLSAALLAAGHVERARQVSVQFWPLARQFDMHPQWADDAALIAALQGRPEAALRLAGFADGAFEALGQPREPVDQRRIDRAVDMSRSALAPVMDEAACRRLMQTGRRMALDELPGLAFETG